ncbi:MAG: heme o synthase [Planctomycetaceae bacterium]
MSIAPSASSVSASVSSPTQIAVDGMSAVLRQRAADYAELCRPRIAVMTMVSVAVGFTLASPIVFDGGTLLISMLGIVQLVAASSILNQFLERCTDARMQRTAGRPIAAGRIPVLEAVAASGLLTASGFVMLWNLVNPVTAIATLATLTVYVLAYTTLKTRTSLCTTVGAIPGAMPPVLGWLAAGGSAGIQALALFALFFVWQFPHFLAIGWIHRHDYQRAGLRMLPSFSDRGRLTGIFAVTYAAAFVPVSLLPTSIGMSGDLYGAAALLLSITYLVYSIRFLLVRSERRARSLLYNSLLCLPLLLIALVVDFLRLTAM